MARWPRRRPSMKPENIKRRLTNRVTSVIAALIIAAVYAAWNKWTATEESVETAPAATEQSAPANTTAHTAKRKQKEAQAGGAPASSTNDDGSARLAELIATQRSNEILTVSARVKKVLPDDNEGSPHQRFLIAAPGGGTVLVAHNIELAPRVDDIAAGDNVTIHGEFEWNDRGGVLHWTHHDPAGRHEGGWIEHNGHRYE